MKTTQSLGEHRLSLLSRHTGNGVSRLRRVTQTRGRDLEGDGGCIAYTLNIFHLIGRKGDFLKNLFSLLFFVCVCVVGEGRGCVLG